MFDLYDPPRHPEMAVYDPGDAPLPRPLSWSDVVVWIGLGALIAAVVLGLGWGVWRLV